MRVLIVAESYPRGADPTLGATVPAEVLGG
jgi:hypothetical protein